MGLLVLIIAISGLKAVSCERDTALIIAPKYAAAKQQTACTLRFFGDAYRVSRSPEPFSAS